MDGRGKKEKVWVMQALTIQATAGTVILLKLF